MKFEGCPEAPKFQESLVLGLRPLQPWFPKAENPGRCLVSHSLPGPRETPHTCPLLSHASSRDWIWLVSAWATHADQTTKLAFCVSGH